MERAEIDHLNIMHRISDRIKEIEFETRSQLSQVSQHSAASRSSKSSSHSKVSIVSKNSKIKNSKQGNVINPSYNAYHSEHSYKTSQSVKTVGSAHSRCSKTSEKIAEAAAEVAAMKAGLQYVEAEARQRAELERLQMKKQLDMASARLNALNDASSDCEGAKTHPIVVKPNMVETLRVEAPEFRPPCPIVDKDTKLAAKNPVAKESFLQSVTCKTDSTTPSHLLNKSHTHEIDPCSALAQKFADQVHLGRIPAPEPGVFSGDPLQYPAWRSAFEILVNLKSIPDPEKLYYLKRYLAGDAKAAVEGHLMFPTSDAYKAAMHLLEDRYGDPFSIADAFRIKLDNWPKISTRDGTGLRRLSDFLNQCQVAMISNQSLQILNDERENRKILNKLPEWLSHRWVRIVSDWRDQTKTFPPFSKFVQFLAKEAKISCDPSVSLQVLVKGRANELSLKSELGSRMTGRVLATGTQETGKQNSTMKSCQLCNKVGHELNECRTFLAMPFEERRNTVKSKNLCFACLRRGHRSRECRSKSTCKRCSGPHPTSLHSEKSPVNKADQSVQTTTQQADLTVRATTAQGNTSDSFLKPHSKTTTIVPVLVHHISNPQHERLVYAMLDTQSDTSFILNSTREALNAPGTTTTLILSTMSASEERISTDRINGLRIRGLNEEITIPLPPTYTRSIMPANRSHIPTPDTTKKWPHLHPIINHLSHELDCEIGLLIGYNCTQALIPREVIPHPDNDGPYGQRTDLGWSVVGVTSPSEVKGDAFGISHRILTKEEGSKSLCQVVMRTSAKELFTPVYSHDPNHEPNDLIKIFERDFSETQDLIFLKLMNEEITKDTKGHYEMPLPLREDKLPLPDNYEMALTRLRSLERRFDKDFNYRKAYTAVMQNILNKRFAERASLDSDGWYLPHHGVKSPKKPGTKEGRKQLKRWGCIFSCLSSRAIHLEVATDLSTDIFINVLRRFISLRGSVSKIRCDQGTNFVGADNELRAALKESTPESNVTLQIEVVNTFLTYPMLVIWGEHGRGAYEQFGAFWVCYSKNMGLS